MGKVPRGAVRRQITALIPVYMNTLMIGCSSGWFSNAVLFLTAGEEVFATSFQCALIASFSELGRIVFAIPAGILTDKYGRKKIVLSVAFLNFFSWLGLSLDTSIGTIYIGRFVIGAAQALSNATALMSVGEISSPEIRGMLTVIYQIFMNVGVVAPSIISVLFSSYKTLAWGVTFFSILSLLSMYWATETPHFLVAVSKPKQAKNILKQIRQGYPENEINNEFEKSQKYIEDEKTRKSELNWLTFIQSKSIRKPILSGILMNFFALLTGAQFIRFYITAIIPSNDKVPVKYYPLANQILLLVLSGITAWYVEKFPRRYMFLLGAAAMVLINAFCAISHHFIEEYRDEDVFKWMFTLGNILVLVCYGTSIQPMTNTLNSELYPQAIKGFCGSLATMSQALSLVILFQLYRFINDHFHLYLMYTVCSLSSIVLYLVVYYLLPEGRGAFLSDLQMKFKEGSLPACS